MSLEAVLALALDRQSRRLQTSLEAVLALATQEGKAGSCSKVSKVIHIEVGRVE